MGTRADFYVGKHETAEWIGSIAWDGYRAGIDNAVLSAVTEESFRAAITRFFTKREDATLPDQGWPWPWDTSATTDRSYWFFDEKVHEVRWGGCYVPVSVPNDDFEDAEEQGEPVQFPDMSDQACVTLGSRSGLIILNT